MKIFLSYEFKFFFGIGWVTMRRRYKMFITLFRVYYILYSTGGITTLLTVYIL